MNPVRLLSNGLAAVLFVACGGKAPPPASQVDEAPSSVEAARPVAQEESPVVPQPQAHTLLPDDDTFYVDEPRDHAQAREKTLLDGGFEGVKIDLPFAVDVQARSTLPLVGVFSRPGPQPSKFEQDAMLVVLGLDRPGAAVAPALLDEKEAVGDEPDPIMESGRYVQGFELDVREQLVEFPWSKGRYRIHVVHRGVVSNGVNVELLGQDTSAQLPELPRIESLGPPQDVAHSDSVTLRGPAKATTEPGGSVVLQGASSGGGPVFILAVGDSPTPSLVRLDVDAARAFSFNLLGDNPLPKAPGTWHVYAFAGEQIAGPVTVQLEAGERPW